MNNCYHQALPVSIESFRESTKAQLLLSHKRKRYSCGATITEKQQKRQGSCDKCARAGK